MFRNVGILSAMVARKLIAGTVAACLLLGACGAEVSPTDTVSQPEEEFDDSGSSSIIDSQKLEECGYGLPVLEKPPRVVTSVSAVTSLVAGLVSGTGVAVSGLVPDGVDALTHEPSDADRELLSRADVVILNGLGYDDSLATVARETGTQRTVVCEAGTASLPASAYIHDSAYPEESQLPNPFAWVVPSVALRMLSAARTALYATMAELPAVIEDNYVALSQQVMSFDRALTKAAGSVPMRNRKVVTTDPTLAYFARQLDFEYVLLGNPNLAAGADVDAFVQAVKDAAVPAVFGPGDVTPDVSARLRDEAGAVWVPVVPLTQLPGRPGEARHSWAGTVSLLGSTLVEALGGDSSAISAVPVDIGIKDSATYAG